MSTTAEIVIQQNDGTYKSINVHWDGYPECVGQILLENYSQVENDARFGLLDLGDLSVLDITPDKSIAYHRDKKEPWSICHPRLHTGHSLDELVEDKYLGDVDYGYIWSDGQWYIYQFEDVKNYQELTEEIVKDGLE